MNLTDALLPGDLLLFAYFLWLLALVQAVRAAPWRLFLASSHRQHVFLGASAALFLMSVRGLPGFLLKQPPRLYIRLSLFQVCV